jgi:hypothetical protein
MLVVEVAFEKSFLSWNHNHRKDADSWNKRYEQPKIAIRGLTFPQNEVIEQD